MFAEEDGPGVGAKVSPTNQGEMILLTGLAVKVSPVPLAVAGAEITMPRESALTETMVAPAGIPVPVTRMPGARLLVNANVILGLPPTVLPRPVVTSATGTEALILPPNIEAVVKSESWPESQMPKREALPAVVGLPKLTPRTLTVAKLLRWKDRNSNLCRRLPLATIVR